MSYLLDRLQHLHQEYSKPEAEPDLTTIKGLCREYCRLSDNKFGGALRQYFHEGNTDATDIEDCRNDAKVVDDLEGFWVAQLLLTLDEAQRYDLYHQITNYPHNEDQDEQ